nr:S8 family serine peptidase [Armatimonadota bacterium]
PHYDEPYDSREGPVDQWYLPKISAPAAWDTLKGTHSNIRLAIIDTGIDYTHPDLKNLMARDSKGTMVGKSFIRGKPDYLDDNGHGTHCAGIANAETDNNTGVAGVGFNSFRLVAAKVLTGKGFGQVDWISNAITWCADNGCRVESMSLGGGSYSQAMQDAVNYAWKKHVLVIAAAGNSRSPAPGYPAGNNHVVAVSATDRDDRLAVFSNYGTPISVGAPGVSILATMPTYECDLSRRGLKLNYDSLAGTSMACPVVAGTFAALLAYQPSLTPTEAVQRVEQTADNTASAPNGGWEMQFGHGRVNLSNALLNNTRQALVGCFYGQVTNSRGGALMGAAVKCGGRQVQTRDDGMFRIANLAPGSYTVDATVDGKSTSEKATIVAGADVNVTIQAGK